MMQNRIYNFAAGPSTLPEEVLQEIQQEMLNYEGSGMSVMEMSHRSKMYLNIFEETKNTLRRVMNIPENYEILFLHGGATGQFSMVPLNLGRTGKADYIVTGNFARKAAQEAAKFITVNIAYDGKDNNFTLIPKQEELRLSADADYVHICANNTIYGTEWRDYPDTGNIPLVADMSSDILSKPVDVSKFGLIYAGAQKNMGIAGLAVVIARKDLLESHRDNIPVLMEYSTMVKNDSMYNTPNTFSIYVLGKVARWIESLGGLEAMEERNRKKAALLYDYLDGSSFYKALADRSARSLMNVTFRTPSEELDALFVRQSSAAGLSNLKGHRVAGGLRASIYNAMSYEGVKALVDFMRDFEKENAR
ncbi:MAG: 3-phosphoserine/phosphohydroxythreonine transaminase [Erysipelotrichaceae bacterium]|nr:3-phosphoserine/phosphohydroxythreonine transaminase [Erysipelotrichaceae bacterium]